MVYKIKETIEIGYVYTVYVKIRYNGDSFFMLGNQFGFKYTDDVKLLDIYQTILERLDIYMEDYDLILDDIEYIQLTCRKKDKIILSDLTINGDLTHVHKHIIEGDKKKLHTYQYPLIIII